MKTLKILSILFISIILISSCRKDSAITEIEMTPPTPETNIETALNGFVTDLSGAPVEDATVKILNNITQTNELGYFEFTGLVNEKFAVIEVEKLGYFNQFETFKPTKTATNRIRIKLYEKNISGILSAAAGGAIDIGQSSRVEFQPNSFVDENGNAYNGDVNIYSFFIDPTDENIDQIMPGNLVALNNDNELNVLQSFGMVNVELEGQSGQKLNINKPATLNVAIPFSIANNAPSEIPLWYFDENNGLWKEEGFATLQNGKYVGEVNHFTVWNCDVPSEVTFLSGQIFDSKGVSITQVRVTDLSTGAFFTDWTDSNGFFETAVPQNVNLLLEVLGLCGNEIIFSINIGPFTDLEVDLGVYNISNNNSYGIFSGSLVDCDLLPIENGKVFFKLVNQNISQQVTTDANGVFSVLVPICDMEETEIRALNPATGFISQPITLIPTTNNDLAIVEVCTNISANLGSVIINVDGEEKVFDNCKVEINPNNNGNTSYLFTYYEAFSNVDTLHYYWSFTDLNNDLNNPTWSVLPIFYSPPLNQSSILYYTYTPLYQGGITQVTVDQAATNPGELLQISFSNLRVGKRINDPTGPNVLETFMGNTMTISAVVQ